jgi:plasmid stabilization system protein ParE
VARQDFGRAIEEHQFRGSKLADDGRTPDAPGKPMIRKVVVLSEAASDIEAGIDFYNRLEPGVGWYFRDSLLADMRRLGTHFGEHRVQFGFFRMLAGKFPYAIYYRDHAEIRQVVAVLDLRRNPEWIEDQIAVRSGKED